MRDQIIRFLSDRNYDVRITNDARFMDQKVTPDVLCIIADCVLQFLGSDQSREFTTKDIWESSYANQNVKSIFNKPDVLNSSASSEYDKFFAQPLKALAYSQVIECHKRGNRNVFTVSNLALLSFIATKERNALIFLAAYLERVLRDSGLWVLFESFFQNQNESNFHVLKDGFRDFLYANTSIKASNRYEPGRIFAKILNPLAQSRGALGTRGGNISADPINYDELMYNRRNWRDIRKLRNETRADWELRAQGEVARVRSAYVDFTLERIKRLIRERNRDVSEVSDQFSNGQATQVHHIFSRSEFPQIEAYPENLILLTATQHLTKAHTGNDTRRISKEYQLVCLLAKSRVIQESISDDDEFYSKDDFVFVLNEGIQPEQPYDGSATFDEIEGRLVTDYQRS